MAAAIQTLELQLPECVDDSQRQSLADRTREEIGRIRKECKRAIDKKASGWFPIHQISGLEAKLRSVTNRALDQVDRLVQSKQ